MAALLAVSAIHSGETTVLEGQALLMQTGDPVAGATVILLETGALTTASRQGEFQFEGVQPGRYHLHAHLESTLEGVAGAIEVTPEGTAPVQLQLSFLTQETQITVSVAGCPESAFDAFQSTHSLTVLELARAEYIALAWAKSSAISRVQASPNGGSGWARHARSFAASTATRI